MLLSYTCKGESEIIQINRMSYKNQTIYFESSDWPILIGISNISNKVWQYLSYEMFRTKKLDLNSTKIASCIADEGGKVFTIIK